MSVHSLARHEATHNEGERSSRTDSDAERVKKSCRRSRAVSMARYCGDACESGHRAG